MLILGPGLGSVPGVPLKEGVRLIGGPLNKDFTAFTNRESNLGYPVCEYLLSVAGDSTG